MLHVTYTHAQHIPENVCFRESEIEIEREREGERDRGVPQVTRAHSSASQSVAISALQRRHNTTTSYYYTR